MLDEKGVTIETLGYRPITSYSNHIDKATLKINSRVLRELLHKKVPDLNIKDTVQLIGKWNTTNEYLDDARAQEQKEGRGVFEKIPFVTADISNYFTQANVTTAELITKTTINRQSGDGWGTNKPGKTLEALMKKEKGKRVDKYQTRMSQGRGYGRFRGTWASLLEVFKRGMENQFAKVGPFLVKQRIGTAMGSPLGPIAADFFSVVYDLGLKKKYDVFWRRHFHIAQILNNSKNIDDKLGIIRMVAKDLEQLEKRGKMVKEALEATYFRGDCYPGCILNIEDCGSVAEFLGIRLAVCENGYVATKARSQNGKSYQSGLGFSTNGEKLGRIFGQIYRGVMAATFKSRQKYLAQVVAETTDDSRQMGYKEQTIAKAIIKLRKGIEDGFLMKKVAF